MQPQITRQNEHYEQYLNKPLPNSKDAERCILGSILLDAQAFERCKQKDLRAEHFYTPFHRQVFAATEVLANTGKQLEPVAIGEQLKKVGALESSGGVAAIANLTYGLPPLADVSGWVETVKEKHTSRQLIKIANQLTSEALAEERDAAELVDYAESLVAACRPAKTEGYAAPRETLKTVIDRAQKIKKMRNEGHYGTIGCPTGFRELDLLNSGVERQEFIIIAGRPSMGKTSMALCVAENAAQEGKLILIFSMEMSREALVTRLLCSLARVDSNRFKQGYCNSEEWERLSEAAARLANLKIVIDTTPEITGLQMRAVARSVEKEYGQALDLIIVDYAGKMTTANLSRKAESRYQEQSQVARDLKSSAVALDVGVIALVQLSRKVEDRRPPVPILSDLRESGEFEQEADQVWFLYREEYYNPTEASAGVADLIVAKNRNNPTGRFKLAWLAEYTRFENYYGD